VPIEGDNQAGNGAGVRALFSTQRNDSVMFRKHYLRDLFTSGPEDVAVAVPDLAFWLGHLRLAEPQRAHGLDVWPLLLDGEAGEPFVLLHQALAAGTFDVLEQGEGVVNEIVARNRGSQPVLVLEGEAIVGAKQNRTVVASVLVGAGQTVSVPVGCVQQGRWSTSWMGFEMAPSMVEPTLRKGTVKEAGTLGRVDQARLWEDVALSLKACRTHSASHDYYEGVASRLDAAAERAKAFDSLPGQVGVIALVNDGLLGLQIIGHPDSWAALGRRLMPSYLMAADLAARDPSRPAATPRLAAPEWLAQVAGARVTTRPSRGLGEQVAIEGPGFAGAGLWHEERPAHLVVFAD
jgi:hypothetical protein